MEINVYDFSRFVDSLGSDTERVCMEINGHDVQVLRFDGDNDNISVYVDNHTTIIPAQDVMDYILARVD